jgi:hypothetical protein
MNPDRGSLKNKARNCRNLNRIQKRNGDLHFAPADLANWRKRIRNVVPKPQLNLHDRWVTNVAALAFNVEEMHWQSDLGLLINGVGSIIVTSVTNTAERSRPRRIVTQASKAGHKW